MIAEEDLSQLSFEGMAVSITKANMKSVKFTDVGRLKSGDRVTVQVQGVVTWVSHGPEENKGQLEGIRLHVIEPLTDSDGRTRAKIIEVS